MAKKDVGEMKRAAGFQNEFWTRFVDAMEQESGSADRLYGADNKSLDAAAKAAVQALLGADTNAIGSTYGLIIDPTRALEQFVEDGNYSYANPSITEENFPSDSAMREVGVTLVHFDRVIGSDEAIREMDRLGLRPATMVELAAFGEQYPDVQRQFPIVELGSVWTDPRGYRRVGYLWSYAGERRLRLYWFDDGWIADDRFLAVRK